MSLSYSLLPLSTLRSFVKTTALCLVISLFASSLFATSAFAQAEEKNKLSAQAQSEEVRELWDDLHKELHALGEKWGKHHKLPPSSWLPKETQKSNKKKIDKLAARLLEGVGSSPLDKVLKERASIVKKITAKEKEIANLEEKSFSAPDKGGMFTKTRATYQKKITERKGEVTQLNRDLGVVMVKIRKTFEEMGLKISQNQVNDLFVVISGDSMREFFIRFSNLRLLSEVIAHHITRSQSGKGYAGQAKRYYAIYVALVYMLMEAHQKTVQKITDVHIPKINSLVKNTDEQIAQTESLMSQPQQAVNRATFEQNLAIQKKLKAASERYKKYLQTQQQRLQKASSDIQLRFDAVLNTYQTISLADSLVSAIKSGVKDISDLQSLTLPKMLPISDDKLKDEFKLVTGKLEGDDFKQWDKR